MSKQEAGLYGGEPNAAQINKDREDYKVLLIQTLNWYSYNKNNDDARKYFVDYVKKTHGKDIAAIVSDSKKSLDSTTGWVARMYVMGATLDDRIINLLEDTVADMQIVEKKEKKVVETTDAPKFNIQEAIEEKARSFIGEYLEPAMDNKFVGFNLLDTMKQLNIPGPYLRWITPWVESKLAQYEYSYNQDMSGYEHLGRIELRKIVKSLTTYKDDLQSYLKVKKASRKPRAIRKKSPLEIVKGLNYMKEFSDLKLKSIYPQEIIGVSALWVFNTKTRKLGCYRAADADGLSVKGSSIVNYKPEDSIQKTIRKPEEVLPLMLACGKIAQRKFLIDIKTTDTELSGRINDDVILLKVY